MQRACLACTKLWVGAPVTHKTRHGGTHSGGRGGRLEAHGHPWLYTEFKVKLCGTLPQKKRKDKEKEMEGKKERMKGGKERGKNAGRVKAAGIPCLSMVPAACPLSAQLVWPTRVLPDLLIKVRSGTSHLLPPFLAFKVIANIYWHLLCTRHCYGGGSPTYISKLNSWQVS